MHVTVSPSRTYVAVCSGANFKSYYFRKFTLPEGEEHENNSDYANWYFLKEIDSFSCVEGCYAYEDYINISDAEKVDPESELASFHKVKQFLERRQT